MKQRGGDFKSPNSGTPDSPGNAKKKRRTSTAGSGSSSTPPAVQSSPMPELVPPPPMMGYGDTIVASNPFDDSPLPPRSMSQMSAGAPHMNMNCPPGSHPSHIHGGSPGHGSPGSQLGSPGPIHIGHGGSQMGPGPPMGNQQMNMGPGPQIGSQMGPGTPMGGGGGNQMGPGPPMGPGGPQMGPNGPQMGPNGPQMGPGGPQMGPGPPMGHGGGHGHPRDSGGPPPQHMPPGMGMGNQPWNGPPKPMQMYHQMGPGGPPNGPMHGSGGSRANGSMGPQMGQGGHMPPGMQQGNMPPHGMLGGPPPENNMPPGMMGPQQQAQWNGPPKPIPMQSGKMYPPDQPMVFNPQNRNAPPIYPCGVCHKEVHDNDQGIPCESGCNFWFHRICTGLTEAAYHFLTQEVYAEWVCDKCLHTKSIPLVKFKP